MADDPLARADGEAQPRRIWEEFLVKIAREVEIVMRREMFTPPGGPTYIPREYIVYLSNDDDKEWRGEKRRGLEQGLFHVLSERARELSGTTQLATKSFTVELRVDGTLNKGEFRVQPVWDASESNQTMVTPRLTEAAAPASDNPTADLDSPDTEMTRVRARPAPSTPLKFGRTAYANRLFPSPSPRSPSVAVRKPPPLICRSKAIPRSAVFMQCSHVTTTDVSG